MNTVVLNCSLFCRENSCFSPDETFGEISRIDFLVLIGNSYKQWVLLSPLRWCSVLGLCGLFSRFLWCIFLVCVRGHTCACLPAFLISQHHFEMSIGWKIFTVTDVLKCWHPWISHSLLRRDLWAEKMSLGVACVQRTVTLFSDACAESIPLHVKMHSC